MDTFELLPVLAAGDLSQTSAPELVAAIYRSRASGTLSLEGENREEIRLFFKLGNSCGAARVSGFRTLTEILLGQRLLTAGQAEKAGAASSSSGKRVGEVLLSMRVLSAEQILSSLALQHRENLRLVLLRNVGRYEWRGWEPPPAWASEVTVDPTRGILEALATAQLAGRRAAVLRWLGDAQVRASVDFAELAHKADLLVADRGAAESFASPLALDGFFADAGLPRPRAEALLVTLLLVGAVEPMPPESAAPLDATLFEPSPPEPPGDALGAEQLPAQESEQPRDFALEAAATEVESAEIVPEPLDDEDDGARSTALNGGADPGAELASELAGEAEAPSRTPKAPLRAPPPLDASELFGEPGSFPAEADPLEVALDAESRSEAIVEEDQDVAEPLEGEPAGDERVPSQGVDLPPIETLPAEEELELVQSRDRSDTHVDPFGDHRRRSGADFLPSADASEASSEEAELELDAPPSAPPPSDLRKKLLSKGMRNLGIGNPVRGEDREHERVVAELRSELQPVPATDEEKCFLEDVRARVKIAPKQDAYSRLGLPQTATQDQIRAAYLGLVKRFHPDKAASSAALRAAAPDLDSLFGMLREAYERVGSPDARAEYDTSAKKTSGNKAQNRTEEARLSLKKGEVYLKKRDYENALRELRHAVELEATAESLTALAWGIASDRSQAGAGRNEALHLVQKALKLDSGLARAHYVAGVLIRTADPDRALLHFQKCVELDPKNSDAALELRLLERRRDQKKPITGPLGRIFKRDGK